MECRFHASAEVSFSGRQNAGNELTRSYFPLNCGFHESALVAFSGRQNAENELTLR
jgi:hypothetical protein